MGRKMGIAALLIAILVLSPAAAADNSEYPSMTARAKVIEISVPEDIYDDWFYMGRQLVTVEIMSGRFKGYVETIENNFTGVPHRDLHLKRGDQVLLLLHVDGGRIHSIGVKEFARDRYLYVLAGLFIVALILIGWLKGLKALISLVLAVFVVFLVVLPVVSKGSKPLGLALPAILLVGAVTIILFGGFKIRTGAAIIGMATGLLCTWAVAAIFGNATKLTGLSGEIQSVFAGQLPAEINLQGLLFIGIIFGVLGAVVDLSLSVAATVFKLREEDSLLAAKELFIAGCQRGKGKLARMINLYGLAVLGCTLPFFLLLAAAGTDYLSAVNMSLVGAEGVRVLAGFFGLLATLPLTAFASALLAKRFCASSPGKVKRR